MILFSYLLSHYLNHALGNISLNAMEYGLRAHVAFWQSPVGTLLLYPALAVHGSLGLWALYKRRYFRWKTTEIIQLSLGLSVPVILCTHLIGERLGRVDGFDQDEAESKRDKRAVILRRLLASKRDTLEALELADRLFDSCPRLVQCFWKEGGHVFGVGSVRDCWTYSALACGLAV